MIDELNSRPIKRNIYVSDEAWHELQRRASSRFVSRYIDALDLDPDKWFDSRPDYIQEVDESLMAAGRKPIWSLETLKRLRTIMLSDVQIRDILLLSKKFLVTNHLRSDGGINSLSRVAAVLEALGLGWLSPISVPITEHISEESHTTIAQASLKKRRYRQSDRMEHLM